MNAVVYTTNTGSTERYAKLLAHETALPAYSLAEAKKKWETNENLTSYIENKQQTTPAVATLAESTK